MLKNIFKKIKNIFISQRVKVPLVLQMEIIECGAASLAMIFAFYKKFIPLEIMRDECGCSRDGSTASSLLKVARSHNMVATGYKEHDIDNLSSYKLPIILFWNFNHFLLYTGKKGDKHYLSDPGFGERVVTTEEMDQSFSGVLLEIYPDENFLPSGKPRSFIELLITRFLHYKDVVFYSVLAGILLIPANIMVPSFSAILVDKLIAGESYAWGTPLLFIALVVAFMILALNNMQQNAIIRFNLKLSLESSFKFFDHIIRLPISFFNFRQPGELANRLSAVDDVANFISQDLAINILSFITFVFYGALLMYYDTFLGFLACSTAISTIVVLTWEIKNQRLISQSTQLDYGRLVGDSTSGIMLMETLRASGAEDDFFATISGVQTNAIMSAQRLELSSLFMRSLPTMLISLNTIGILVFGALRVLFGSISMGELLSFQILIGYFFTPIVTLVGMLSSVQKLDVTMGRIDDIFSYKKDPIFQKDKSISDDEKMGKLQGYIELRNITFGYNPIKAPILENFSLKISAGERIALVGSSGSGKSTVAKLLTGLYTPWSGEITFDGKLRSEVSATLFANSFAVVDQDIFMFKGTVYENLSMRNRAISIQTVQQAAIDSEIYEEISQRPSGFFSEVEEYGKNFSGGQRQRLEIARALSVNPSVLILDEATGALDPITELRVDKNIRRRGCTMIIIAHRLSTIRDADRIIVIEQGKIVEQGNHQELLTLNGYYSKLIESM